MILVWCDARGQQFRFSSILSTDSIPLGKVTAITQDKRGFIWFIEQGNNDLARYDGNRMLRYKWDPSDSNSITDKGLEAICADEEGKLWIGVAGGVDEFDPERNQFKHHYFPKDAEVNSNVHSIIRARDGLVWLGTGNGLFSFNPQTETFRLFKYDSADAHSISSNEVWVVYEDRQGSIWAGTGFPFFPAKQGGLNLLDRKSGKFTRYLNDPKNPESLANDNVSALYEDSHGVFWVGTGGDGLQTMNRDKGTFQHYLYDPAHPEKLSRPPLHNENFQDFISFIREDGMGQLWIGSIFSGLNSYNPQTQKTTLHNKNNGYPNYSAFTAFTSKDGILWIGTQWPPNALYKYDPFQNEYFSWVANEGPTSMIYEDKQGNIWVGKEDSIFFEFPKGDSSRPIRFQLPLTQANLPVRYALMDIAENNPRSYWLATSDGILDFDPQAGTFSRISHDPDNQDRFKYFIGGFMSDSQGKRWIHTASGIVIWDPRSGFISNIRPNPNDSTRLCGNARRILEYPQGVYWISIYPDHGIDRYEGENKPVRHYIRKMVVNKMFVDSRNVLWAGTPKGIYHYDPATDQFIPLLSTYSDIERSEILNIFEDQEHNLWLISHSQVFRLDSSRKTAVTFGKNYGIVPFSLDESGRKLMDGRILIGAHDGFYVFDPGNMRSNQAAPILSLLDLYIDNKLILPGNKKVLLQNLNESGEIILEHDQDNFSISFKGFHYSEPGDNKDFYMLENYDLGWRSLTSDNMASYFKVPPGNYVFRMKSRSANGVWSERSIDIIIHPPWWLSWWAYVLYAIGFAVVVWSIYKEQKLKIIQAEREKTKDRELSQAKEIEKAYHTLKETQAQLVQSEKMASLGELTAGIAHEIQNPLNFVNNFAELNKELIYDMNLELDKGNIDEVRRIARDIASNEEKIGEHGKRADSIVKGMLLHSRISSGTREPTDINALCDEYLRLCYHGLRAKDKSFNASIETHFDAKLPKVNVVPQDIGRVLLNICNNAFYAVNERRAIEKGDYQATVKLSTREIPGNSVEITISDNGSGIPQKVMEKIFQPFFTTKPTGQGTGLGLSMSYDIIKAHGGEIKVSTKEGEGSEFAIEIPLTK